VADDVLVETEIAIQQRPFEVVESDPYREYCEVGGILEEDTFDDALNAYQKREEQPQKFSDPTKQQAKDYASKFRFELTPEQTFLYCFLREQEGLLPLPDQEVFVETLLMTKDFKKHSKFTSAFPNIFKKQTCV